METFLQNLINALSLGGTYAMLALGLTLVFTVLRLTNFAHGELITITGYTLVFGLTIEIGTPFVVILGIAAAGVAAVLMERTAFRPFRGADPLMLLLTSFALSIGLQVLFQGLISTRAKGLYLDLGVPVTIDVAGVQIDGLKLLTAVVAVLTLLGVSVFLRRTTLGLSMRAAAENFAVARLMGIRANMVIAVAFLMSGVLAGIAGVLWVAQRGSVDPLMGMTPLLKAFTAAILGGLGSLMGSAVAGLILGGLEVGFQTYLPSDAVGYRDALVWIVLILVLVFRPQGLFGRPNEKL